MSSKVTVFEVGPRDGLQNEKRLVPLKNKLFLISGLVKAGIREMEVGAFVRPDRVPQMADTEAIYQAIHSGKLKLGKTRVWSLVPNIKGFYRAFEVGARSIAVFTAASNTFSKKNTGMTLSESLRELKKIVELASKNKMLVRGYLSTAFGCPFEGKIRPTQVLQLVDQLLTLGVFQVSVGDTIGVATPKDVERVLKPALQAFHPTHLAVHFHDTRGTALANALRSLELGVVNFDSSAGGLGGCPFAPGASGNLATEDLIYMLHGMGIKTGVDLTQLAQLSLQFAKQLRRSLSSRFLQAYSAQCSKV